MVQGRREGIAIDAVLLSGQREAEALERAQQQAAGAREALLLAQAERERVPAPPPSPHQRRRLTYHLSPTPSA